MTTVRLDSRSARQVQRGLPWLYREGLKLAPPAGDVVQLSDGKSVLATAFYCERGPIALRVLGAGALTVDRQLLVARLRAALHRRTQLDAFARTHAFRWVHGEADGLPGLFVDRYGDVVVLQVMTQAMDARTTLVVEALVEVARPRLIVARNDGSARDFESLPRHKAVLYGDGSTQVTYEDAGNQVTVDVMVDGKTGGFLDQLENHAAALHYARPFAGAGGRGLDAFTYHGGFALALGRAGLGSVLALDESAAAVERARHNAKVNQLDQVTVRCVNAFDELRRLEAAGEQFDVVVIDPPALAKRRSGDTAAERAYKELNLRGMRLVRSDGILVSCSCSGRLSPERFGELLVDAARDAGRAVQLLERRGAGRDHPPLLGVPETEYLKCFIMRVL